MDSVPTRSIALATAFLRWWGGELRSCLPARLRCWLDGRRSVLQLSLLEGRTEVLPIRGGDPILLPSLQEREVLANAVRDIAERRTPAEIRIADRSGSMRILRRCIQLPSAAAENLSNVLALEMDRLTPFQSEEILFGYRALPGDARDTLAVDLAIVHRRDYGPLLALIDVAGLKPKRITLCAAEGPIIDLTDAPGSPAERATTPRLFLAGVAAMLALVFAVGALTGSRGDELSMLKARAADLRSEAARADEMRTALEARSRSKAALLAIQGNRTPVVVVLEELSRRLPADTWLVSLELSGRDLILSGYADKASSLIALLEESALFQSVDFRSPVTSNAWMRQERFTLAAQIYPAEQWASFLDDEK